MQRTFSQCGEDTFLTQNFFHEKRDGFHVDVGAHHPFRYSNSALFHERGWRGINIDVDERAIAAFREHRPDDINVLTGVAAEAGEMEVHLFNEGAVNTLSAETARGYVGTNGWEVIERKTVPVLPLSRILQEHLPPGQAIDFMDIDVEGLDDVVLHSNDWDRFRPTALLVEVHGATPYTILASGTAQYLAKQGYQIAGIQTLDDLPPCALNFSLTPTRHGKRRQKLRRILLDDGIARC